MFLSSLLPSGLGKGKEPKVTLTKAIAVTKNRREQFSALLALFPLFYYRYSNFQYDVFGKKEI